MLTSVWIVAVLVAALALAYVNASGLVFTAAIAVALGVAWVAPTIPGWLALALTLVFIVLAIPGNRAGAAAQARQRRGARGIPQGDAADVADRARGDRGRHRLVGRRALLGPSELGTAARNALREAVRGRAAVPRPRRPGTVRDGDRLGNDQRPPRPAPARLAVHQGPRLSRDEHRRRSTAGWDSPPTRTPRS